MKILKLFLCIAAGTALGLTARGAEPGSEVVVIYNTRSAESLGIARHYAEVRKVPAGQVFGFDLTENENISREDFQQKLQKPLWDALLAKGLWKSRKTTQTVTNGVTVLQGAVAEATVRYAVLCYGVPLRILEDKNLVEKDADKVPAQLRRNGACVDSELACLALLESGIPLTGPVLNTFYGTTNSTVLNPTNGLLLVTRLDGPTAVIARQLVDKAVEAEKNGLWGRAYFDLRGITNEPYLVGEQELARASEYSRRAGYETVVDTQPAVFGAGFPLSQIAFYAGWYEANVAGALAGPTVEFMPGAFAYHLQSTSAATLKSTDRYWVGPLLSRGVTATMGCVDEPYLAGTPDMAVFFDGFLRRGWTYGEAAYSDQRLLSWQTTVVGDPLYRPFAKSMEQRRQELQAGTNSATEWLELNTLNLRLADGGGNQEAVVTLNSLPLTKSSAVLEEKLAELDFQLGKLEASTEAMKAALSLGPSPQQRIRLELALADALYRLGRKEESIQTYQRFLKEHPDSPVKQIVQARVAELNGGGK